MKVVIAMDSFKGSISSLEAAEAVGEGIRRAHPNAEIVSLPLADGGEGTVDALIASLGAERVCATVSGPLGEAVTAEYGLKDGLAVMEMAAMPTSWAIQKETSLTALTEALDIMQQVRTTRFTGGSDLLQRKIV